MTSIGFVMFVVGWIVKEADCLFDSEFPMVFGPICAIVGFALMAFGVAVKLWEVMP